MTLNPNSLRHWWPLICNLGIPVPRTAIHPEPSPGFLDAWFYAMADGEPAPDADAWRDWLGGLRWGAEQIGLPCFMRTDLTSAKHDWERTCYLIDPFNIPAQLFAILEYAEMGFLSGHTAVVFREFLPLDWRFRAFRGMPVAVEQRVFVRDGRPVCSHPYWPVEALEGHVIEPADWAYLLGQMDMEAEQRGEIVRLLADAARVGEALPGYWSVDFARHKDGRWFLIDIARGEESWHAAGCPNKLTGGAEGP
jgi:hypothetical protein